MSSHGPVRRAPTIDNTTDESTQDVRQMVSLFEPQHKTGSTFGKRVESTDRVEEFADVNRYCEAESEDIAGVASYANVAASKSSVKVGDLDLQQSLSYRLPEAVDNMTSSQHTLTSGLYHAKVGLS